jgi:hypothetical protein
MIKKQQTTQGPSVPKTKSAVVPPPHHPHTSNIALPGVGKRRDHKLQATTMTQASRGSPTPNDSRPAGSKAVSNKEDLKQK